MAGFYCLPRGWMEGSAFRRESFNRHSAWVWLNEQAMFRSTEIAFAQRAVVVPKGAFVGSLRGLCKAWDWQLGAVRRFLAALEHDGFIAVESSADMTIIRILPGGMASVVAEPAPEPIGEETQHLVYDGPETHKNPAIYPAHPPTITRTLPGTANGTQISSVPAVIDPTPGTPLEGSPERYPAQQPAHIFKEEVKKEEGIKKVTPPIGGDARARGTRLPDEFMVPQDWLDEAREARAKARLPEIDLTTEALKFANHFTASSKANAIKRDWRKTWINWCLNPKFMVGGSSQNGTLGNDLFALRQAQGQRAGDDAIRALAAAAVDRTLVRRPAGSGLH